jgi:hypothetical protein
LHKYSGAREQAACDCVSEPYLLRNVGSLGVKRKDSPRYSEYPKADSEFNVSCVYV